MVEIYLAEWRKVGFRARLVRGDDRRETGWACVRAWLQPYEFEGRRTARVQIVRSATPSLVRTLPQLVHSETKPEDVGDGCEDHAVEALRYALMSRPVAKAAPKVNESSYFDAAAIFKEVEDRKKRAHFIGHEHEYERMTGRIDRDR